MNAHLPKLSRRRFLRNSTAIVATASVVPASVLGLRGATPPSEKLNIACIGIGGRGKDDLDGVSGQNIVALCDVDQRHAGASFKRFPNAKAYQDFRKMLDEVEKQIDAVVVATPDHTHAVAAIRAIKMGKHVYCEKPLAHSVHEVRALMMAARQYKVVTQLGNQGHSFDSNRTFQEAIRDGAIGTVREVHAFCASSYSQIDRLPQLKEHPSIPPTLDWDLWLGPVPYRPYNPAYLPGSWRGWSAFGTGIIGDWTCHVIDPVFWALDLRFPTTVMAETGDYDPAIHGETFPKGTTIHYQFPAQGNRPAVKITWYDGDHKAPRPDELKPGAQLPGIGAVVIGDKGKILYGSHGATSWRIIPESKMDAYHQPSPTLPRSPGHYEEWIAACKAGRPAGSSFDYGGPLTEVALLGIIAIRLRNQELAWDGPSMKFTNSPEANKLLTPTFRTGWTL